MRHLTRAFIVVLVLVMAFFVGLAVAVVSAMAGHEILVLRYGEDLNSIDDTLPMAVAGGAAYLAGLVGGLVTFVVGWRHLVMRPSPGASQRLGYAIGWSLVGWLAAIFAGNVLYGSANALVYVVAVGFGVAAYALLLLRDRRLAAPQHHSS